MQNQNPVLHFQKFHQKMKTLCRNSEVHHHKTRENVFRKQNIFIHKTFIKPAQAQDSEESWWTKCRIHAQGQRFSRIPRFFGTIRDPDKVPKNLGILENLGPVHESCTLFIRILRNLGPVHESCTFLGIKIFRINTRKVRLNSSENKGMR